MFFFQMPRLPEKFVAANIAKMLVAGSYNRTVWNHETLAPYVEAISTGRCRGPVNCTAALRGDVGHHAKPSPSRRRRSSFGVRRTGS